MRDASNPTTRVVEVLNFLAAHPTESFSLAEISRQLGLSNGSAHRILTTLANARFLSRNEKRRTYSLGMAMVAIGQAAVEKNRGIEVARCAITRLASDLNVQCSANTVVEDEILVLAKEGAAQSERGITRVGERRPLVPPLGLCHVAWGGEDVIASYVERVTPYISHEVRDHLLETFPLIRERGYSLCANASDTGRSGANPPQATNLSSGIELVAGLTANEVQLFEIGNVGPEGVSHITAPVFSPSGAVALQLVISGMPRGLSTGEIERYAEKLCAAAAGVTAETHGRPPQN